MANRHNFTDAEQKQYDVAEAYIRKVADQVLERAKTILLDHIVDITQGRTANVNRELKKASIVHRLELNLDLLKALEEPKNYSEVRANFQRMYQRLKASPDLTKQFPHIKVLVEILEKA